ncbi:hypothetical protein Q7P37_008918 [Cladosporium fusiforme]
MLREVKLLLSASAIATLGMPSISTDHSLPCQIYPISTFTAGEKLQFQLIGDHERSCRVVVAFSDPKFLPVSLLAVPQDCSGYQMATLRLPESLADGYASVQWQCEGEFTTSCNVLDVVGGCNDPEAFAKAGTWIQEPTPRIAPQQHLGLRDPFTSIEHHLLSPLTNMCNDGVINSSDLEKLLSVLQNNFEEVEERLDRIERLICEQTKGVGQGKRADLRRWTTSVATKVGIRLLRGLAKEAVPKNAGALLELLETYRAKGRAK